MKGKGRKGGRDRIRDKKSGRRGQVHANGRAMGDAMRRAHAHLRHILTFRIPKTPPLFFFVAAILVQLLCFCLCQCDQ